MRWGAFGERMKKVFLIVFLLFQISFLFAEKEYLSSDGYFLYFFSDDFTGYKYTTLDDYGNFSETKKIQKKVSNGITIWTIGNKDYVLFQSENYFILMNHENTFKFIKSYDDYWFNEIEVTADYEASTWKKKGINRYDEFNLLYLSFSPWISESDNSGIEEYITIDAQKTFSSFRIINGFIDIDNPQYFEEYNKVRELSVFDMNNNLIGNYKIENNSTIQSFNLSGKFTYVKFLITDIYEGTKYDDVAITTLQCY